MHVTMMIYLPTLTALRALVCSVIFTETFKAFSERIDDLTPLINIQSNEIQTEIQRMRTMTIATYMNWLAMTEP